MKEKVSAEFHYYLDKDDKFSYEKFLESINQKIATKQSKKAEKNITKTLKKWDQKRKEEIDRFCLNHIIKKKEKGKIDKLTLKKIKKQKEFINMKKPKILEMLQVVKKESGLFYVGFVLFVNRYDLEENREG